MATPKCVKCDHTVFSTVYATWNGVRGFFINYSNCGAVVVTWVPEKVKVKS